MESIENKLRLLPVNEARAALYYLMRYLKQAAQFKNYRKDIFDEDDRSAPNDEIRRTTLELIEHIEGSESKSAEAFDDPTYEKWSAVIRKVENGLDPELTARSLQRVQQFMDGLEPPIFKK